MNGKPKMPNMQEMQEMAKKLKTDNDIHEMIEELQELNDTQLLLHTFQIPEHDLNKKEYSIFELSSTELEIMKQLISERFLFVEMVYDLPKFPEQDEVISNFIDEKDLTYDVVLTGKSEDLWVLNLTFHGKWLEEYLAFDYEPEQRVEIFPVSFWNVVDEALDYSWCQDEFIGKKMKDKVREINKYMTKNGMDGYKRPKVGISMLYTPYCTHRAHRANKNVSNMKEYLFKVFMDFKDSGFRPTNYKNYNDFKAFIISLMVGYSCTRSISGQLETINGKFAWHPGLDRTLDILASKGLINEEDKEPALEYIKLNFIDPKDPTQNEPQIDKNGLEVMQMLGKVLGISPDDMRGVKVRQLEMPEEINTAVKEVADKTKPKTKKEKNEKKGKEKDDKSKDSKSGKSKKDKR